MPSFTNRTSLVLRTVTRMSWRHKSLGSSAGSRVQVSLIVWIAHPFSFQQQRVRELPGFAAADAGIPRLFGEPDADLDVLPSGWRDGDLVFSLVDDGCHGGDSTPLGNGWTTSGHTLPPRPPHEQNRPSGAPAPAGQALVNRAPPRVRGGKRRRWVG